MNEPDVGDVVFRCPRCGKIIGSRELAESELLTVCVGFTGNEHEELPMMRQRVVPASDLIAYREFADWLLELDDIEGPGAEARRSVTLTNIIERARRARGEPGRPTDPRTPGGGITNVGDPYERHGSVVDTRNAVLLAETVVTLMDQPTKPDEPVIVGLELAGQINRTQTQSRILYLMNEDGVASLVSELVGVASRASFAPEFVVRLMERLDLLPEGDSSGEPR